MSTIVTFVAFSDVTARLIQQTERFAKALDAQVVLVHLVPPEPLMMEMGIASAMSSQEHRQELIDADYRRLSALVDSLNRAGVQAQAEQLADADSDRAMEPCEQWKADLIIVGSHHHSAIYNAFVGSFRDKLLRASRCPVLVVPAIPVQS